MFGKVMSIPDTLIVRYFELVTDIHPDELAVIRENLNSGSVNPRDCKMKLAREITTLYHGPESAAFAEEHFKTVFQRRETPDNIGEFNIPCCMFENGIVDVMKLLVQVGFSPSNSEARRLISQGAVKVNGKKISSLKISELRDGDIIQAGKLKFIRVRIKR